MKLSRFLTSATLLSAHPHQRTYRVGDRVARLFQHEGGRSAIAQPRHPGLACWERFARLDPAECAPLKLDPSHRWMLATRPFLVGRPLNASDTARFLELGQRLASALRALHAEGVVHGDVQPANVILTADGPVLIDLPHAPPEQVRRVAGCAPLMAPERFVDGPLLPASDVYSLCTLICWLATGGRYPLQADDLASWAQAHQQGTPKLPAALNGKVAGLVGRGLEKDPRLRPTIQELLDGLTETGEAPAPDFVAFPAQTYQPLEERVEEAFHTGTQAVLIEGDHRCGKSHVAQRLTRGFQLLEEPVLYLTPRGLLGPGPFDETSLFPSDDPFEPVRALIALLSTSQDSTSSSELSAVTGDRLHVMESWRLRLLTALAQPAVLVIDDFHSLLPDTQAFFAHFLARQFDEPERALFLVATTSAESTDEFVGPALRMQLTAPEPEHWTRWRATTLLAEVRDIASGKWERLLAQFSARPMELFRAINTELGAPVPEDLRAGVLPEEAPSSGLEGSWHQNLDKLFAQGAYTQALQTCRRLAERITDEALFQSWFDALLRTSFDATEVAYFEARLIEAAAKNEALAALYLTRLYYELGRFSEALERLDSLGETGHQPRFLCWQAQVLLSSGRFDEARKAASVGLSLCSENDTDPVSTAHLKVIAAAARALPGDPAATDELFALSPTLATPAVGPELRARAHAYRAIGLTRQDRLEEAADAYLRALEEVESAGLLGQMPTYLLNAGTAYHRQGRFGLAREYYARGSRLAGPSTRHSTRALLLANEANIDITLGRLEEARPLVERALAISKTHNLGAIAAMCRSLSGDIAHAAGDPAEALAIYDRALQEPGAGPPQRASLLLYSAQACLDLGQHRRAQEFLDRARALIEAEQIADLEHHQGMVRARQQWTDGQSLGTMAGIELFRRHLLGAAEASNHRLVLQQSPYLLAQLKKEGLSELVDELRQVVNRSNNAVAMGLSRKLREDFFNHLPELLLESPAGNTPRTAQVARADQTELQEQTARFYRLLSLNELILTVEDPQQLWARALDIALSLSGAERGYLLIRDHKKSRIGDFYVAASRDIDGEEIRRPHLKVSRTISEEAARTGQTVVTINAREDTRFDSALSVVDLDLTSVLCVPVRDGSGVLGALYLDHRFQPGVFDGECPRMMEAFGHQLALAITNLRRLQALQQEQKRLSEANEALDRLLAERDAALSELLERVDTLTSAVEEERLRSASKPGQRRYPNIAFSSAPMEQLFQQVERIAPTDISVVIEGESGVGKELIAETIHHRSARRNHPFVAFNCGAISESLFESEMFGHVRGAFTGASTTRQGLFQAAHGGTLFLDEVGELPLAMQAKLLRALQEGRVRPVGADRDVTVDVRVIAATNRTLLTMIENKRFREDLYYRLAALVLNVPPLRERPTDIPLIARHLLEKKAQQKDTAPLRLPPETAQVLMRYPWPGNVRELENALAAASVFSDGEELSAEALLGVLDGERLQIAAFQRSPTPAQDGRGRPPKATRQEVIDALRLHKDHIDDAARHLQVSTRTLYRYLQRYDIS